MDLTTLYLVIVTLGVGLIIGVYIGEKLGHIQQVIVRPTGDGQVHVETHGKTSKPTIKPGVLRLTEDREVELDEA